MRKATILGNNRGSILVGAVAMAFLMALAGTGFLLVTVNNMNNESAALENEKAFQAAESGVWIAARWLRSTFDTVLTSTGPFAATPIAINGMNVYDTIVVIGSPPVASINATVYKSGTPGAATFKKRVRVGDIRGQNYGIFCTFYGGYQPVDAPQWNGTTWINNWDGLGTNRNLYGRTHFNNMPITLNNNAPRFYGLVTVARGNGGYGAGLGLEKGDRGNDYSNGISGYGHTSATIPTLNELNAIFTDRFIPNVDPIVLNVTDTSATSLGLSTDPAITTSKISLPLSIRDSGYGPYMYRPTLYFDGNTAHYQYRKDLTASGYKDSIFTGFDGKIFLCSNNLNVYSTANGVTGNVTVATASGKSIVPVGNLFTHDVSGSWTVPATSNNMIGLISGGYIAFNKTWTKHFSTDANDSAWYVSSQTSGTGGAGSVDGSGAATHTLNITASIMAVCHFTDALYNGTAWQNFTMSGTEWWDGMWGQIPPTTPDINSSYFVDIPNKSEDYGFQLYGNHILAAYSRSIYGYVGSPARPARGCNGSITFNPDPRMSQRNLQPPGFPGVKNGTTLLTLRLKNWSEENAY